MNNNYLNQLIYLIFGDKNYGVTKIKNTEHESVYACECRNMLRKDKYYLFVIGAKDIISIGANVRIEDITNINCLQFRTFMEPMLQKVLVNKIEIDPAVNSIPIKRYNISQDNVQKISEYLFEYEKHSYNVHLFHTTDSDFEYVTEGSLYSALITWNTMIIPSVDIVSRQAPTSQEFIRQTGNVPPPSASSSSKTYLPQPAIRGGVGNAIQPAPTPPKRNKQPLYSQYHQNILPQQR